MRKYGNYYDTSGRLVFVRFLEFEGTKKTFPNQLTFKNTWTVSCATITGRACTYTILNGVKIFMKSYLNTTLALKCLNKNKSMSIICPSFSYFLILKNRLLKQLFYSFVKKYSFYSFKKMVCESILNSSNVTEQKHWPRCAKYSMSFLKRKITHSPPGTSCLALAHC